MKYRLYVDEVGNSDLGASHDPNHRYLSLTGIILELDYVQSTVFPAIEELKQRYFALTPMSQSSCIARSWLIRSHPLIAYTTQALSKRSTTICWGC